MPATQQDPLTLEEQFAVLDFDFYVPWLLQQNASGKVARRAAVTELTREEPDGDQASKAACKALVWFLQEADGWEHLASDQDAAAKVDESIRDVLRMMTPDAVARLFDQFMPDVVAEGRGKSQQDTLRELVQAHREKSDPKKRTAEPELNEPPMQFAERQRRESARELNDRIDRDLGYPARSQSPADEAEATARRIHGRIFNPNAKSPTHQ